MRIIIVDDDIVFGQVLARALVRRGYEVLTATTLSETQALIKQNIPDAAIVDLKLAEESGLNLIPVLKEANTQIKIVMLSAYASVPTVVEAIKLGADNYLCKPANTEEILKALFEDEADENLPHDLADIESPLSVQRLEWEHIQRILRENNGNISATAKALGMHRRTLQRKLGKKPVKQ
jgi:two-component system response regulator RegA